MSSQNNMANNPTSVVELPRPIWRKFFKFFGLALFPYRKSHMYCPDSFVRKALKLVGAEEVMPFGEIAREVISHNRTLLDYDRLYTLYQAIQSLTNTSIDDGCIAEVGVYKGGSAYFIATIVERLTHKRAKIFLFDTFQGHAGCDIDSALDGPHTTGKFTDTSYEEVSKYLSGFSNVIAFKGRFQDQCHRVEDETFSFAHLDVDIYEPTVACLHFFSTRLKASGIIVVDDYGYKTCEGAKKAVDEFVEGNPQFVRLHIPTGQCLLIKVC